jgi:hypothetical protein
MLQAAALTTSQNRTFWRRAIRGWTVFPQAVSQPSRSGVGVEIVSSTRLESQSVAAETEDIVDMSLCKKFDESRFMDGR